MYIIKKLTLLTLVSIILSSPVLATYYTSVPVDKTCTLTSGAASDLDCFYPSGECPELVSDMGFSYSWTAKWEGTQNDAGTFPSGNSGMSVQWTAPSTSGGVDITVTASNTGDKADESGSDEETIAVVKVDKLQYNDPTSGWTDVSGTLYVHKGDSIEFKAIKSPADASWPSGKPVWGGTSGASGTGETKNVTFNTVSSNSTDYKTVTAECGNTITANVIVCEVEVTDIQFDHDDPASGHNDALDIREDYSTDISVPEWVNGGQNKPAAYIKSLSNVDIKARFSISPTVSPTTKILATTGSAILGNINEVSGISFSSGTSGYVRFTAAGSTPSSIDKGTVQWQWKVKDFGQGSGEININTSGSHTIYTVLDTPDSPQAEPWTDTLDISCNVASGRSTTATATRDIWDDFYYSAGGTYDTTSGAPQYAQSPNPHTTGNFDLTSWLGNYPSIGTVNCYDMGKAVVVFANALGCGASYTYVSPFGYLNCVRPIGCGWTNNPFHDNDDYDPNAIVGEDDADDGIPDNYAGRSGFGNHGFSRLGSNIYDASGGRVDVDGNPDDGPPHTERELDGDDTWTSDYDDRVIDDDPPITPGTPSNYSFNVE